MHIGCLQLIDDSRHTVRPKSRELSIPCGIVRCADDTEPMWWRTPLASQDRHRTDRTFRFR